MEKKHVSFDRACEILEKAFGLPPLEEDGEEERERERPLQSFSLYQETQTFDDHRKSLKKSLDIVTYEKELPMDAVLSLWYVFDKICWLVEQDKLSEKKGRESLLKVREKLISLQRDFFECKG